MKTYFSLAGQTLTCAERVRSISHHLVSYTPRISWRVNWVSDDENGGARLPFLESCLGRLKTCLRRTRPN